MIKVAFFGGTFNPPHQGHLWIAQQVMEKFNLDKIYFCPSYISPNKINMPVLDANIRLYLLEMAIMDNPSFEVLDLEVNRPCVSYTINTITQLYCKLSKDGQVLINPIYLILGDELFKTITEWKRFDELLNLVHFISYSRNQQCLAQSSLKDSVTIMDDAVIWPISSSLIRKRIKEGKSIQYLVPKLLQEYIQMHGLYR